MDALLVMAGLSDLVSVGSLKKPHFGQVYSIEVATSADAYQEDREA